MKNLPQKEKQEKVGKKGNEKPTPKIKVRKSREKRQ